MKTGVFCFLSDKYYVDFPDDKLMKNKEVVDGVLHDRPCFFAFQDSDCDEIYWLIPISTKYEKYKALYDKKVLRYGKCNTIRFGVVLGNRAAFLIQNMCPATDEYIREVYVDKNSNVVQINKNTVRDVISNASEVLSKHKRGNKNLIFPDVDKIKAALIEKRRFV